ncbi:MAG: N-acetylneuraminate synthase family protein, partial [Alkalispirochaeta sp.]
ELISAAKSAGADTAKFQLVRADEILHPLSGSVDLPGGSLPLYERFRELERDISFYQHIQETCTQEGIRFLCTPFGIESARMLRTLGVDEYKVASPELNHHPLLREISGYSKPIILSTGVARIRDIGETLDLLESLNVHVPIQLLHCVTSYPAREEEYNIRVLPAMRRIFGFPVGISDHSIDPILVPVLAAIYGAVTIESTSPSPATTAASTTRSLLIRRSSGGWSMRYRRSPGASPNRPTRSIIVESRKSS